MVLRHNHRKQYSFKAKSPLEFESDDFQENMGVRVSDLGGNDITLDLLMRDMEKALSDKMTDFQLLERKKKGNSGKRKSGEFCIYHPA